MRVWCGVRVSECVYVWCVLCREAEREKKKIKNNNFVVCSTPIIIWLCDTERTNAQIRQYIRYSMCVFLFITFKNDKNLKREKNVLFYAMNFADVSTFIYFFFFSSSINLLRLLLQLLHRMFHFSCRCSLSCTLSVSFALLPSRALSLFRSLCV